ncbi:MAG: hypothetical protein NTY86_18315 [Deltaproteobacteria bacterium]|nr:hypothetical protein [Deltaproteobacteria bacterium]
MPMISPIIKPGKIHLGIETLRCPRCKFLNKVEITSDLPVEDWLTCAQCHYKALLDIRPILQKYGLPQGLSVEEKRDFSNHLQRDLKKMQRAAAALALLPGEGRLPKNNMREATPCHC